MGSVVRCKRSGGSVVLKDGFGHLRSDIATEIGTRVNFERYLLYFEND